MASAKGVKVANAIVTVTPTAEGARKSIEDAIVNPASQAGDKAGKKSGEGIAGGISTAKLAIGNALGNILSSAAQKGAQMVTETFKKAFEGAGNREQLQGGVEKIFTGMDNSVIFKDAQGAWKDLNISANDYMATINDVGAMFKASMGDEKAYTAARRGMLAISDYASGTGKDLGTLNEKFAMISRATSSYQSIADQFAGILPATSADFLSQAQAAGFLEGKYKKLTEVPINEYQEALTKMLEKGTADLGLAGNTAAETAGTITGSLAGLSSAWDNWLTDVMSGSDTLDDSTSALLENLGNVIANSAPVIINGVKTVLQQIPTLVPEIATQIYGAIQQAFPQADSFLAPILDGFNNVKPFIEAFVNIVKGAAEKFMEAFGPAIESLMPKLEGLGGQLSELGEKVGPIFLEIFEKLGPVIEGVGGLLGGVLGEALNAIVGILQMCVGWISNVLAALAPIISALLDVLVPAISLYINWLKNLWTFVLSVIGNIASAIGSFLSNTVGGIIGFCQNVVKKAGEIFWKIADVISAPFKKAFEAIRNLWNSTVAGFGFDVPDWVPGIGGSKIRIPYMANGGIVTGPTQAMIGEAGPEAVVPLSANKLQPLLDEAGVGSGMGDVYIDGAKINDDPEIKEAFLTFMYMLKRKAELNVCIA